jgi:hypothetical protein
MFDSQPILIEQRRNDLIREREMQTLAKIAQAGQEASNPFYADTLAALGRQLITWGEQLEERYTMACADTPQPALRPES